MNVEPLGPIDVVELFPEERESLIQLLSSLTEQQWATPTVCPGWTVKDVALHLLGVDLANLSRRRDGFQDPSTQGPNGESWSDLVGFVNALNESWVEAARRISPRLLCELLAFTGHAMYVYFSSLDLSVTGASVSWAGPDPAPVWLDIAREYTERWVHQQQIREALDRPGFTSPHQFGPVLEAFVHALPHTLHDVDASPGTRLRLIIDGAAGGVWVATKTDEGWLLGKDDNPGADATVTMNQDVAWRLFTRGMARDEAARRTRFEGDRPLGLNVLDMVSIIA